MPDKHDPKPITIAFAKENCEGIQVHCLRCQNFKVIGFDGFQDRDLVIDLPRLHRMTCERCGGTWLETRPQYPSFDSRSKWYGLQPK